MFKLITLNCLINEEYILCKLIHFYRTDPNSVEFQFGLTELASYAFESAEM